MFHFSQEKKSEMCGDAMVVDVSSSLLLKGNCIAFLLNIFRLDTTSSPLPGSLSSVGTPESLSSADSPGFTFRPVDSPSPGRPILPVTDEPMHEERQPELSKQDQVMTSVEQNPS